MISQSSNNVETQSRLEPAKQLVPYDSGFIDEQSISNSSSELKQSDSIEFIQPKPMPTSGYYDSLPVDRGKLPLKEDNEKTGIKAKIMKIFRPEKNVKPMPVLDARKKPLIYTEPQVEDISHTLKSISVKDHLDSITETEEQSPASIRKSNIKPSASSGSLKAPLKTSTSSGSLKNPNKRNWFSNVLKRDDQSQHKPNTLFGLPRSFSLRSRKSSEDVLKPVEENQRVAGKIKGTIKAPSCAPARVAKASILRRSEEDDKAYRMRDYISVLRGKYPLNKEFKMKYRLGHLIGDGAFGFVLAAKRISDGRAMAVKFIFRDKVNVDNWVFDDDLKLWMPFECHFLKQVEHENIIKYVELLNDEKYIYFVTELHGTAWVKGNPKLSKHDGHVISNTKMVKSPYYDDFVKSEEEIDPKEIQSLSDDELIKRKRISYDLFECIDYHRCLTEDKSCYVFSQLVRVVDFLSSIGYVHRDLKDENVVIDENYDIKLIDFGSCAKIPDNDDENTWFDRFNGTLHFASPEVLHGHRYKGPEAEVWALGVILYTMLYGENPFSTPEDILSGKIRYRNESVGTVDLLKRIFEPNPKKRITLAGIKKHPSMVKYFQGDT